MLRFNNVFNVWGFNGVQNVSFIRPRRVWALPGALAATAFLLAAPGVARSQTWENLPQGGIVPTNSVLAQNTTNPVNPQGDQILQQTPATNGETGIQNAEVNGPQSSSEGNFFSLTGLGSGIGQTLKNAGIYLGGSYTGTFMGNVSGGNRPGNGVDSDVFLGTDLDMNTIAGIKGAAVHFYIDSRSGPNTSNWTGSAFSTPASFGPSDTTRLEEFTWDQSLFNDHVRVLIGRTNPTFDFDFAAIYCDFIGINSCANSSGWYFNNASEASPVSEWGARITLKPTPQTYFRFGAYEENPDSNANSAHGFGNSWTAQNAVGAMVPFQVGYETNFDNDQFPRTFDVGAYYDSSAYADPLATNPAFGGAAPALGSATYLHDPQRTAVWAQFQQTIYRPDTKTHRNVTVFGNFFFNTTGVAPIAAQWTTGVVWQGPMASRPHDYIGIVNTVYQINQRYQQALVSSIGGGATHVPSTENILEADYGLQIAPGISLQPYVQWIVDPNQEFVPYAPTKSSLPQAIATGMQLNFSLNDALGLPAFARSN
jgi:carbohydrate-selective porin OprB